MFARNTDAIRHGTANLARTRSGRTPFAIDWDSDSTYIRSPSYLDRISPTAEPFPTVLEARALLRFGDNVTTDHISPAGAIPRDSAAAEYLSAAGVAPVTSTNTPPGEAITKSCSAAPLPMRPCTTSCSRPTKAARAHGPTPATAAQVLPIYDAAKTYGDTTAGDHRRQQLRRRIQPRLGSEVPALLGVRAVIADSFERIHRSNLIGMGIFPIQFQAGDEIPALNGSESLRLHGLDRIEVGTNRILLDIVRADGRRDSRALGLRVDTVNEIEYLQHRGTLPYVIRKVLRP